MKSFHIAKDNALGLPIATKESVKKELDTTAFMKD